MRPSNWYGLDGPPRGVCGPGGPDYDAPERCENCGQARNVEDLDEQGLCGGCRPPAEHCAECERRIDPTDGAALDEGLCGVCVRQAAYERDCEQRGDCDRDEGRARRRP